MVLIAVAIAVAVVVVSRQLRNLPDSRDLSERKYTIQTLGIQIVCGDCAGDSFVPVRSLLSERGCCANCGGSSFVLASELARGRMLLASKRLRSSFPDSQNNNVYPFPRR